MTITKQERMYVRSAAIGVGALASLTLTLQATAGPPAGDDFNDGDAAGWVENDQLKDTFGPTTYAVEDGAYRMTSQVLPPIPEFVGAGVGFAPSMGEPAAYSEGTVRAKVQFHNDATNAGIFMRAPNTTTGYHFFLNNFEDGIGVDDLATPGGNIDIAEFSLTEGVDYMVQARAVGSELSIKVWEHGTSEPDNPQVVVQDSTYEIGPITMIVYNQSSEAGGTGGALDASFDDFTFTPTDTDLLDDFVDGASGWAPVHNMADVGGASYSVIESEYQLGSVDALPDANELYFAAAARNETYANAEFRNGVVRTKFRLHNGQTNMQVLMRHSGDADQGSFYGFFANKANPNFDGGIGITRWENGVPRWEEFVELPLVVEQDYYLEASAIGDQLAIKVWATSSDEPDSPQVALSDSSSNESETGIAILAYNQPGIGGQISGSFGDVWFTPMVVGDVNGDGSVGVGDLLQLLSAWGECDDPGACPEDLDGDGSVGVNDLLTLLGNWS